MPKNVLIITFFFPPMSEIGGIRIYGLVKYLKFYHWNPIVITPSLPEAPNESIHIIQTPYNSNIEMWKIKLGLNPNITLNEQFAIAREKDHPSIIDRLVFIPSEIITYPDGNKGWYKHAIQAADQLLKTQQIDAIISSSNPITCHLIAKTIANKYHIPWIADFRDLWSQNHYNNHCRFRKIADRRLEKNTLRKAMALVTVSQPLADELSLLHPNKSIYVIPNGFDPEQEVIIPTKLTKKFSITYTGVLYNGKRDPRIVFHILKQLLDMGELCENDIEVNFFGYKEPWLIEEIMESKLDNIVNLFDFVPRNCSISFQRESQILLLLLWNNPKDKGVYTGKIFDYLAAKRPIMVIGGPKDSVVKDLINQTQAGVYISNAKELQEFLLQSYREFKEIGKVQYRGIEEEIMKYSHNEMGRKFAQILNKISEKLGRDLIM